MQLPPYPSGGTDEATGQLLDNSQASGGRREKRRGWKGRNSREISKVGGNGVEENAFPLSPRIKEGIPEAFFPMYLNPCPFYPPQSQETSLLSSPEPIWLPQVTPQLLATSFRCHHSL